jgi:hypothetical protein
VFVLTDVVMQILRSESSEIQKVFADWLEAQRPAGVRLVVLEGFMQSGKSKLIEGLSGTLDLDDFLKRPVLPRTSFQEAINRPALNKALSDTIAALPLVIVQGAVGWPIVRRATVLPSETIRRVYLKRMQKLNPELWQDEDSILDTDHWPSTEFVRSVHRYHAEQKPWLIAELVLERIEG